MPLSRGCGALTGATKSTATRRRTRRPDRRRLLPRKKWQSWSVRFASTSARCRRRCSSFSLWRSITITRRLSGPPGFLPARYAPAFPVLAAMSGSGSSRPHLLLPPSSPQPGSGRRQFRQRSASEQRSASSGKRDIFRSENLLTVSVPLAEASAIGRTGSAQSLFGHQRRIGTHRFHSVPNAYGADQRRNPPLIYNHPAAQRPATAFLAFSMALKNSVTTRTRSGLSFLLIAVLLGIGVRGRICQGSLPSELSRHNPVDRSTAPRIKGPEADRIELL